MKRVLAMLLAGCMLLQSLPGLSVTAFAEEDVITLADGGGTVTADSGGSEDILSMEEVPVDISVAPESSGGDPSQNPPAGEDTGGIAGGGSSDVQISGDEIIADIDVINPVGENGGESGTNESGETEKESEAANGENSLEVELMATSEDGNEMDSNTSESEPKSYIEVKVVAGQLFIPDPEKEGLKVSVKVSGTGDPEGQFDTKAFKKPGDVQTFEFEVPKGTYTVTVSAPRYASYEQQVPVGKSQRAKICVSTARSVKTGEEAVSGWLRLGNATGSETVDETDIEAILTDIHKGVTDVSGLTNLNKGLDDKTDIADLQIAVQNKSKDEQKSSVEIQQIPLSPQIETGTKIEWQGCGWQCCDCHAEAERGKRNITGESRSDIVPACG